jgi:NADPH2:quinone reductase
MYDIIPTSLGNFGGPLPLVIGSDFGGVIEAVGKGVENFKVGDEVYGMALGGVSVSEDHIVDHRLQC